MVARYEVPGSMKNQARPVGNGMIGAQGRSVTLSGERASRPTQTVPYGTGRFLNAFQAMNCLATITWSLRDNKLVRHLST
jgi:hypothetical protein